MTEQRPPLPPFTEETAKQKVRAAEDGWNNRNPEKVSMAYTPENFLTLHGQAQQLQIAFC